MLKNLAHKGVNFEAPNALKLTYEHLDFQKKFRGLYPRTPVKRERKEEGEGKGGEPDDGKKGANVVHLDSQWAIVTA